jgi:hypothetical protein
MTFLDYYLDSSYRYELCVHCDCESRSNDAVIEEVFAEVVRKRREDLCARDTMMSLSSLPTTTNDPGELDTRRRMETSTSDDRHEGPEMHASDR